jgi:hypothetical protein
MPLFLLCDLSEANDLSALRGEPDGTNSFGTFDHAAIQ